VIGNVSAVADLFSANGWAVTNLVDPYWKLAINCAVQPSFYPCP